MSAYITTAELEALIASEPRRLRPSGTRNLRNYGTIKEEPRRPNEVRPDDLGSALDAFEEEQGSFEDYLSCLWLALPFFWPGRSCGVLLCLVLTMSIGIGGRFLNFLLPALIGHVVDTIGNNPAFHISHPTGWYSFVQENQPYLELGAFLIFRLLHSPLAFGLVTTLSWTPIYWSARLNMEAAALDHLKARSASIVHIVQLNEITRTVIAGRQIVLLLKFAFFRLLPLILDVTVGLSYFYFFHGYQLVFVTLVATSLFVYLSVKLGKSLEHRRLLHVGKTRVSSYGSGSTYLSFSSIGTGSVEEERRSVREEIGDYMRTLKTQFRAAYTLLGLPILVLLAGFLSALLLGALQVTQGEKSVGSSVTMVAYWAQLALALSKFPYFLSETLQHLPASRDLHRFFHAAPGDGGILGGGRTTLITTPFSGVYGDRYFGYTPVVAGREVL
ncbi:MAG: hypothetical protein M1817_002995 [Caeruleum heppii]|nr:MAG: hypothetical protein M1817_002995 [Caeruleum heppii]